MTDEAEWIQAPVKTYRGHPLADGTGSVSVDMGDGRDTRFLKPRNEAVGFTWGRKGISPGESDLAFVMLTDALGSEMAATKVYQRFKHRVIGLLGLGSPWSLSHKDVTDVVDEITRVERDTAPIRAQMAHQNPPVAPSTFGLPIAVQTSPKDQGADRGLEDPATMEARRTAMAKLSPEEKKALGL
jgi:hypothetical protein